MRGGKGEEVVWDAFAFFKFIAIFWNTSIDVFFFFGGMRKWNSRVTMVNIIRVVFWFNTNCSILSKKVDINPPSTWSCCKKHPAVASTLGIVPPVAPTHLS